MIDTIITKMKYSDIYEVKELETSQNINILSTDSIKNDLSNDNYMYFIAKIKNEIVGYIAISQVIDTVDILSIVVKETYKRHKVGTQLLNHILNLKNVTKIMLEVRKSNINAQNFYEKMGFTKIYTREKYYPDNFEDAYIYEKITTI